ncbi:DUF4270 domain-containing protein [Lacinutrix salivirga]
MKNIFKTISVLTLIVFTSIACDKDFTSIESDIEGIQNFEATSEKFPLVAYTKRLGPVQTNNLSSNLLGVYDDAFGVSEYNIVTQLVPTSFNPDFGDNPVIESVTLNIPYYSKLTDTDIEGNNTYTLDSIFGEGPIKLSIYKNNYFLRDFDPDSELGEAQKYYSTEAVDFASINTELLYESGTEGFIPSPSETLIEEVNEDGETVVLSRIPPSLRLSLTNNDLENSMFWEDLLLFGTDSPTELSNVNNFKDYFRGLYFKVEAINGTGTAMLLDFNAGTLTIDYTNDEEAEEDFEESPNRPSEYVLNLAENRINLFDNNFTINDGDSQNGDDLVYIKGTEGYLTVIDLFNGIKQDENGANIDAYNYFEDNYKSDTEDGQHKRLINEAFLVVNINQNDLQLNPEQESDRVMLYDLKNNKPVDDYFFDRSENTTSPINSKIIHSTRLTRDDDNNGIQYKIRITEHLNNILIRDSTNAKLGLLVSTNVNRIQNAMIKGTNPETNTVTGIPEGAVISPKGNVIYGSTDNVPENKRLQLEIFYTEPQN